MTENSVESKVGRDLTELESKDVLRQLLTDHGLYSDDLWVLLEFGVVSVQTGWPWKHDARPLLTGYKPETLWTDLYKHFALRLGPANE